MANYNKAITATSVRLGEVRFSYANVFAKRTNDDGSDGKYSVCLLIPKADAQAKKPSSTQKPGVRVLENGVMSGALDSDDFYPGCWGAVVVNFFPYSVSGNVGVAAGLNNLIKTRDDDRFGGGRSADADFGDMASDSFLD